MSIYRRADGRWVGSLDLGRNVNGKRQRHVVYGQLRREVVAKLDEARSRLAADEPVRDARVTVAGFVNDWLEKALPASPRRPTTQATYAALARTHLTPAPFGALPLDRLRPSDIEALLLANGTPGWLNGPCGPSIRSFGKRLILRCATGLYVAIPPRP